MAGKAIGEFSFKAITATYSPGPAGGVLNQVNWEGTASGFGAVFGTATFAGGGKGGTYASSGEAFMDDGSVLTGGGPGTVESTGKPLANEGIHGPLRWAESRHRRRDRPGLAVVEGDNLRDRLSGLRSSRIGAAVIGSPPLFSTSLRDSAVFCHRIADCASSRDHALG